MKPDKKTLRLAVLISLGLHLMLFFSCQKILIKGINVVLEGTRKLMDVRIVRERIYIKGSRSMGAARMEEVIRFSRPDKSVLTSGVEKAVDAPLEKKFSETNRRDDNISLKADIPKRDVVVFTEETVKITEQRRRVNADISGADKDLPPVEPVAMKLNEGEDYLPAEFAKSMPGFTPDALDSGMKKARQMKESGMLKNVRYQPGSVGQKYDQLDEYLVADLAVYDDPRDGGRYFKITIMAGKDAGKFKVIPKEIVFLVDCSLSIQSKRIRGFKTGLSYCLMNLNKNDKFNIISFRDKVEKLNPGSVPSGPETREAAGRFIDSLRSTESTDVYDAFSEVIRSAPALKPSYILLLSDGKPTAGVTNSRDLIVRITGINKKIRPVFCFSGGSRVNRYLLDFISYRNRGWAEYSDKSVNIASGLAGLYDKIKDPILLNLRYRFSHLPDREVYPKELPDFYKGAAFTLYGRFDKEPDFSIQLLGDTQGHTKEFILADSFKNADKGDSSIARQWAFNKIYYLIGEITEKGASAALNEEINLLCNKFDIKTPYSEEIK